MTTNTLQLTRCPECGRVAEIDRRTVLESTNGPIEHALVRCVDRHWCLLPVQLLTHDGPTVAPRPAVTERR